MSTSPFKKAILHAKETARRGGTVADCGYRRGAWRSVWLKTFENEQQIALPFKKEITKNGT